MYIKKDAKTCHYINIRQSIFQNKEYYFRKTKMFFYNARLMHQKVIEILNMLHPIICFRMLKTNPNTENIRREI